MSMTQITNPDFESKHARGQDGKFATMERDEAPLEIEGQSYAFQRDDKKIPYRDRYDIHVKAPDGQHIILKSSNGCFYDAYTEHGIMVNHDYTNRGNAIQDVTSGELTDYMHNPKYDETVYDDDGRQYTIKSVEGKYYDIYDDEGNYVLGGENRESATLTVQRGEAEKWRRIPGITGADRIDRNGDRIWETGDDTHMSVSADGNTTSYWRKGKMHRDENEGPAYKDAYVEMYIRNGKVHRKNGPAVINHNTGEQEWFRNGQPHRDEKDGPAYERESTGAFRYVQNGITNRSDGPAIRDDNGNQAWMVNGQPHRLDGPALEYPNGTSHFYVDGQEVQPQVCMVCGRQTPLGHGCPDHQ